MASQEPSENVEIEVEIEVEVTVAEPSPEPVRPSRLPLPFLHDIRKLGRPASTGAQSPAVGSPQPREGHRIGNLPFLSELLRSRRKRRESRRQRETRDTEGQSSFSTEIITNSPNVESSLLTPSSSQQAQVYIMGELNKTSKARRDGAKPGPSRKRTFRLTGESLEYLQQFSQVKVRRSFPLTSIEKVEPEEDSPKIFSLIFYSYIMILEADTQEMADRWVELITREWKKWQFPDMDSSLLRDATIDEEMEDEEEGGGTHLEEEHVEEKHRELGVEEHTLDLSDVEDDEPSRSQSVSSQRLRAFTEVSPSHHIGSRSDVVSPSPSTGRRVSAPATSKGAGPGGVYGGDFGTGIRSRSHTAGEMLRRESTEVDMTTYDVRKNRVNRHAIRIRKAVNLAPRLKKSTHLIVEGESSHVRLHDDYAMIKYPQRRWSIPSEKLFKIDKDNLQILWRRSEGSPFSLSNTLSLHRVVEIREGQLTEKFDRFPYEEVAEQSFSLIYDASFKGGKYVRLESLDIICDHPDSFRDWINGLRTLITGPQSSLFNSLYDDTDPTILWLKRVWMCKSSDHEITQKTAEVFCRQLRPQLSQDQAKALIREAHQHQFRHTFHRGNALRWDGFTLLFNLICGTSGPVHKLFKSYARRYPHLGLMKSELREFLMKECGWSQSQCTSQELISLIKHHDYHYRACKKFVAGNKPLDYQIACGLLSYAGFLSFLRSKDNSVIDLDHESVCQDMTQPLSHYFINSSHNTYLEADQLYGKSTFDAYIRVLLQGCRCIEIDCWDDTLNVTGLSEPVIYHGYTLTTKLPFREVIRVIKEYAFRTSLYPIIISIENHCSAAQQKKMARIFTSLMKDMLIWENLVEKQGRDRLPSPQELQGKIILKGSFKNANKGTNPKPAKKTRIGASPSHPPALGKKSTSVASTSSVTSDMSFEVVPMPPTEPLTEPPTEPPTSPLQKDASVTGATLASSGLGLGAGTGLHNDSRHTRQSLRKFTRAVESGDSVELVGDDQELAFEETSEDLKRLVVYCRSVSIRPWSWRKQKQTSVCEMFSFSEISAGRHCKDSPQQVIACAERQMVRTYPKGVRFDSSNYNPMTLWSCGIQMIALNYQFPDVNMHLSQGLFRMNGACGYVLKPEVMRNLSPSGGATPYSPDMEAPHPDIPTVELEIELLSGQRLCPWGKKSVNQVFVDIQTFGIAADCYKMMATRTGGCFWPWWGSEQQVLRCRILMPDICLVYFRVENVRNQCFGQNCIPLSILNPGIKFVPLRTPGGELIPESGLFVRIKKGEDVAKKPSKHGLRHQEKMEEEEETAGFDVEASILPHQLRQPLTRQSGGSTSPHLRPLSSPPNISLEEAIEGGGGRGKGGGWRTGEKKQWDFSVSSSVEKEEGGRPLQHPERTSVGQQVVVVAEVEGDLGTSPTSPHFGPSPVSMGTQSPSPLHMVDHKPVLDLTPPEPAADQPNGQKEFVFSVQPSSGGEDGVYLSSVSEPEKEFHLELTLDIDDADLI